MQLYRRRKEIEDVGARLVLIGQGSPRQAVHFRRRHGVELPVLADEHVASYEAVGTKRAGLSGLLKPSVVASGVAKAVKNRQLQGRPVGDVQRLGAVLVVAPGGEVMWHHVAEDAADNPKIDEIVERVDGAT